METYRKSRAAGVAGADAVSRRHALKTLGLLAGAVALGGAETVAAATTRPGPPWAAGTAGPGAPRAAGPAPSPEQSTHPEPRPGIDASSVLPRDRVAPHAQDLYDQVRRIPHVVDGLRCHCGCADLAGMYSLLSCYGPSGMAQYCETCSGEGRLAWELHSQGKSLDEIRAAVDRRFG